MKRAYRYLAVAALASLFAFVGCGGSNINLGNSAGSGGSACDSQSCVTPCGYTSDYPGGGATGVLFCDLDHNCASSMPQCRGAAGGPTGGAFNVAGFSGTPEVGGAAPEVAGSPTGGAPSPAGAGGTGGAGGCGAVSCGTLCGYYSQYPGGPTQPMMCDASQRCTPVVPDCSSLSAGAGGR